MLINIATNLLSVMLSINRSNEGAKRLRRLLEGGVHAVPGVYNPFTAILVEKCNFEAAYLSGAALTGSLGMPDLGLITLDELRFFTRRITSVIRIPLIVDADTGFGEPLNVMRTVSELKLEGAAAVQIEDQVMPKRCGHLEGKAVISAEDMVRKIAAAVRARGSDDLVIVARTDARSVLGLEEAIRRARIYVRAGAEVIFPEALETEEEFEEFASRVDAPLMANMTEFGKTPYISLKRFGELGYRLVLFPVTIFRVASKATLKALMLLKEEGTQIRLLDEMMSRSEFYELIGYRSYEEADKQLSEFRVMLDSD